MSKLSKKADEQLVLGPTPRADLLPGELKLEAKARGQRRALLGIVILSVVLVVAAYAYATINSTIAAATLSTANARTATLLSEQGKYIEGKLVASQTDAIKKAQTLGASTEIDWRSYLLAVEDSLPSGTSIKSITAATVLPGAIATKPESPLQAENIAVINFAVETSELPDVSRWIDNLSELPGYGTAVPGTIQSDSEGVYTVSIMMLVNENALSQRFAPEEVAK